MPPGGTSSWLGVTESEAKVLHDRAETLLRRRGLRVAALAGVLLVAFAALSLAVRTTPLPLDSAVLTWVLHARVAWVTTLAVAVTTTGSGLPAYLLAAIAGTVAAPSRWWAGVAVCELALLAGQGIRLLIAALCNRPRPATVYWAAFANGPSFPSGHTTTSALVAALLCAAVSLRLHGPARRALQVVVVMWAVAVGLTRVYLAVHWATDVLGGWLLAGGLSLLVYSAVLIIGRGGNRRLARSMTRRREG